MKPNPAEILRWDDLGDAAQVANVQMQGCSDIFTAHESDAELVLGREASGFAERVQWFSSHFVGAVGDRF